MVAPTSRHFKDHIGVRGGYKTNATLSKTTIGMRLGHLHAFFHRINTWGYDDAPSRIPIMLGDKPIRDKPLPRFLDDPSAAKLLQAARNLPEQFDRLAVELLARTGMRKGELLGLTIDAVVQIGSAFWLRTPVGKMHTDRYIPLHPSLKQMLDRWLAVGPTGRPATYCSPTAAVQSRLRVSTKPSKKPLPQQVSATSTPINSDTLWPPRRSTAA